MADDFEKDLEAALAAEPEVEDSRLGQFAGLSPQSADGFEAELEEIVVGPSEPPQDGGGPAVFSDSVRGMTQGMRRMADNMPIGGAMLRGGAIATDLINELPETIGNIPAAFKGVGQGGVLHYENTRLGGQQGTQPHVVGAKGEYLRPLVGKITSEDEVGNLFYSDAEGNYIPVDREMQVVLRDPMDGELTVFQRTPDWDEGGFASAGRGLIEGMLTGPVTGATPAAGRAVAASGQALLPAAKSADEITLSVPRLPGAVRGAERAADAQRDLQAFEAAGQTPPGLAFHQPPLASVGKQISDTPIVGAPVRKGLEQNYFALADDVKGIQRDISPLDPTYDEVGQTVQKGFDRYFNDGLKKIPPESLREMGVTPESPVNVRDMMSAKAAKRAQEADAIRADVGGDFSETTRGVGVNQAQTRNQTFTARRGASDMSDAEIQTIIRAPAQQTSIGAKQEALYERAWRRLPTLRKSNGDIDAGLLAQKNTSAALREIDENIANSIAGQKTINEELAEKIRNPRANMTLGDMRAVRTEVGRSLSNFGTYDAQLDRGQLNSLYGALSRDIEVGILDLANRAMIKTQLPKTAKDYISMDEARRAADALRAYRIADRFSRASHSRMDKFLRAVDSKTPERAADTLIKAAQEGAAGNMKLVQTAKSALKPEEWNEVSALVLQRLGRPKDSARGIVQEAGFSPQSLVTNYTKMDQRSRNMLFGPEHAKAIEGVFNMSNRIANVEDLLNGSRSATNTLNVVTTLGTLSSIFTGNVASALAWGGSGFAVSLLLSRPQYARWLTGYLRLRAKALEAPAQVKISAPMIAHINKFGRLAEQNPALVPLLEAVKKENGMQTSSGSQDFMNVVEQ